MMLMTLVMMMKFIKELPSKRHMKTLQRSLKTKGSPRTVTQRAPEKSYTFTGSWRTRR